MNDITVPVSDVVVALDVLIEGVKNGSETRTRSEVNEIIHAAANTEAKVSLRKMGSLSADSRIRKLGDKATSAVIKYSSPVADVPEDVRIRCFNRVQEVANRVAEYITVLDSTLDHTVPVSSVTDRARKFDEELDNATAEGDDHQRRAAAQRDAERRAREAEEAERRRKAEAKRREEQAKRDAERRERDEEERRRRNTSFGTGFGGGYIAGGGFGGGGGIGFGGGSNGSW